MVKEAEAPQTLSLEELSRLVDQQMAKAKAEEQRRRYRDLSPETVLWLALAPGWTAELAEAAGMPSGRRRSAAETLEVAREAGLVGGSDASRAPASSDSSDEPAEPTTYVMDGGWRAEVLKENLDDPKRREALLPTASRMGQGILKAAQAGVAVAAPIRRWAALAARATDPQAMADTLDEAVGEAVRRGDSGEVHYWIEAARPLAALPARDSGLRMNLALQRAGRQAELLARRRVDEQHLAHMLSREEQLAALDRLLDPAGSEQWALHLIGAGGVGKTMLVRYVTSRLARGRDIPVARIDFDYLNPDFPSRTPGQLLWAFAQELAAYERGRAAGLFGQADEQLRRLHEELSAARTHSPDRRATDHPAFHQALMGYIDALREISQGNPVLLVVDTCEELAKTAPALAAGEAEPENISELFRILCAMRYGPQVLDGAPPAETGRGLPGLRVLLAGRRPLASAGYRWRCPSCRYAERPYLRLHEIRGFTHDETQRFLKGMGIGDELVPAIIRRSSPDAGSVVAVEWEDAADRPADVPRCNPYDLALYSTWAAEDPTLTAETVLTATPAQYVELRIIRRLRSDALETLLPAVALLGHFDSRMLRTVADAADDPAFEASFEALRHQEWIDPRWVALRGGDETRLFLDVEPGVQLRLLAYFRGQGRRLEQARRRAADVLQEATEQADLGALDWPYFDAALRALEPEPARAAKWWQGVERRLLTERDLAWAARLTEILLGPAGAVATHDKSGPPESCLRPLVQATHAAVLLHSGAWSQAASTWEEVAHTAPGFPVAEVRERLEVRAQAGRIATGRFSGTLPKLDRLPAVSPEAVQGDPQLAAALVAAAEAQVEAAETLAGTDPAAAIKLLSRPQPPPDAAGTADERAQPELEPVWLAETLSQALPGWQSAQPGAESAGDLAGLVAFACSLAGRALALGGQAERAVEWFRRALPLVIGLPAKGQRPWADWLPPADLEARIRLELVRAACPAALPPEAMLAWAPTEVGAAAGAADSVDADRLQSAVLRLRLAQGPVPVADLPGGPVGEAGQAAPPEGVGVPGPAECNAHRAVPPLFVTVAAALAAAGQADEAARRLRTVSTQESRFDLETVRAAEMELLRLARRMRLRDEGESSGQALAGVQVPEVQALRWALDGLDGEKGQATPPQVPETAAGLPAEVREAWLHAIWQTRFAPPAERDEAVAVWAGEHLAAYREPPGWWATTGFHRLALYLDAIEAGLPAPTPARDKEGDVALPGSWLRGNRHRPAEALTLALRAHVGLHLPQLGGLHPRPGTDVWDQTLEENLAGRLGTRRAAEIALEEGELLALRQPRSAAGLFETALDWFEACGDAAGTVIAGTALALVRGPLPDGEGLGPALDRVRKAYEMCTAEGGQLCGELPPWPALEAAAEAGADGMPGLLDALAPPAWRPWLVRLVACLVRRRQIGGTGSQAAATALLAWVGARYGRADGERVRLPADFCAGPFADEMRPVAGPPETVSVAGASTGNTGLRQGLVYLLVGLAIACGLLVGGFFLVRWLAGFVTDVSNIGVGGQIGLYVALLAVLLVLAVLCPVAWRGAARWLAARSRLALAISPDPAGRPTLTLTRWSPRIDLGGWPPIRRRPAVEGSGPMQPLAVPLATYREAGAALPGPIVEALERWRTRLGRRDRPTIEMEIEAGAGLHSLCWEGAIALGARPSGQAGPLPTSLAGQPFRFRRQTPVAATSASAPPGRGFSKLVWADGQVARQVAAQGWEALDRDRNFGSGGGQGSTEKSMEAAGVGAVRILHLLGTAEETPAGLRFRVAHDRMGSKVKQATQAQRPAYGGRQVQAGDMKEFPGLALCVVQGEPGEARVGRLETDRSEANRARAFAAEVFARGVPIVIVLPPLEPALAAVAVARLAAAVRQRRRNGTAALERAVRDMQSEILTAQAGDPQAAWEVAMDVCLYAVPRWDGRLTA